MPEGPRDRPEAPIQLARRDGSTRPSWGDKRGYRWEPFQPGNQAGRRHGVWAADAHDEAARVVSDLLPQADIERFPIVALIFAETWVRWRRAVADIAARGEMLGEGEDAKAHPLLPHESRLRRDLLDLVARFGLDPRAEAELARDRADAAKLTVDLDTVLARGRAAWAAHELSDADSGGAVGALTVSVDDGEGEGVNGAEDGRE